MNPRSIRELLGRQPFEYLVRHPENLALAGSRVVVTDPVANRLAILALPHSNGYRMLQPA